MVEVETDLAPPDLLLACLSIEERMGRTRGVRWGPRLIDLDLLTYGHEEVHLDDPDLTIPHPLMHERAFVLLPLAELDPDPPLPGGRRLDGLRTGVTTMAAVQPYAPPLRIAGSSRG